MNEVSHNPIEPSEGPPQEPLGQQDGLPRPAVAAEPNNPPAPPPAETLPAEAPAAEVTAAEVTAAAEPEAMPAEVLAGLEVHPATPPPAEPSTEPAAEQEVVAAEEIAEPYPVEGQFAEPPPIASEAVQPVTAETAPAGEEMPPAQAVEPVEPFPEAAVAPPPAEEPPPPAEPKSEKMDWYILKVQSNREESIKEGLLRRVAIAGLGRYFGEVIVPTEKVTEVKAGKKRVTKRKLYPGYLIVQMEYNAETWYLVRETPGIGDFTSGRFDPNKEEAPTPMLPHEVARILAKQEERSEKAPKLKIAFSPGDQVKINEGTFENFEGQVESIDETNGRVTVMINIFGRSTPAELEYWQIGTA